VRLPENAVIGSVGPLYAETEIRLVDIGSGATIYPGENYFGKKGELHVKGPQVMAGYYKNPEATAKVLKDGWMNTGDLAVMTANGCLKIVGRSKETIVLMNGENVEPVPIESKLLESPLY
jgi:long-chain acyl-CoA synthetase